MSHIFVNVFNMLLFSFSRILDNCGSRELWEQGNSCKNNY